MSRIGAELYDHDGYPSLAEIVGTITPPMFLALRVCECGRVGEYAHTRCGRDARHNMRAACPAITVQYAVDERRPEDYA